MQRKSKRILAALLSAVLCIGWMPAMTDNASSVIAADKTLSLEQCKSLGEANSIDIKKTQSKIALKEISYKQAVKSANLKVKNKTTFRWSPLLSFKFPQPLTEDEAADTTLKPAKVQTAITGLRHKLSDLVYASNESVTCLYVNCYAYQEKLDFQKERLVTLQDTLEKNKARLQVGAAKKSDVDSIESSITALETSIAENERNFTNKKQKLGDLIGMDVTYGYSFANPFLQSDIPREQLDALVKYTLDNDQSYYEAQLETQMALLEVKTNFNLLKNKFGNKTNDISPYISKLINGETIDSDAFKAAYEKFLTKIDQPWSGSFRILFIKISKEFMKGEVDGTRYVENEPYIVYENAMNYQDLKLEQESLAKDLEQQIRDDYETLISARNSYQNLQTQMDKDKKSLEAQKVQNMMGLCTFEEYTEAQNQYEQLQIDALDSLETYTTMLTSYNRLTCGAVDKYLKSDSASLNQTAGGQSYVVDDTEAGPRYYILSKIESGMFEIGVFIPDDYETEVTDFEFWIDGNQIGNKTSISNSITHLAFALDSVENAVIKLYNGESFVSEAKIDPMTYDGPLDLKGQFKVVEEAATTVTIGTFTVSPEENDMASIKLDINPEEGVASYIISYSADGTVKSEDMIPIDQAFSYLSFITTSLEELSIQCFDQNGSKLYDAYFDSDKLEIYKYK